MSSSWLDLYADGRRLNRVIRYIERKMKKCTDDDKIKNYANSIAYLTAKKVEIIDRCLSVKALIRDGQKQSPKAMSNRFSKENIEATQEEELK